MIEVSRVPSGNNFQNCQPNNRSSDDLDNGFGTPPQDGIRYSGFRVFAGMILALSASVGIWVGAIFLYYKITGI